MPSVAVFFRTSCTRCPFEGVGRQIANPRCPITRRPVANKFFNTMSQARRTQARRRATDCILPGVQTSGEGSHKVSERLQPFKEGFSGEPPDSHNVVVEQPQVEPQERTPDEMRVRSEEESTDFPYIAARSTRPNASQPTGRHSVYNIFSQRSELCSL